jgi:organic hydroperoxide reductase OsmC/OhrA
VPKIDKATFERIAQDTKVGCPVSRALKGVDIQVKAELV